MGRQQCIIQPVIGEPHNKKSSSVTCPTLAAGLHNHLGLV